MEIFANHAHVFPDNVREQGSIDSLLALMDTCDIARAVQMLLQTGRLRFAAELPDLSMLQRELLQFQAADSVDGVLAKAVAMPA